MLKTLACFVLLLSPAIFAQNAVTVVSPNGGETWVVGTKQDIIWTKSGSTTTTVKIEYSTNGGSSWTVIASSETNDGNYNWTIPNTLSTTCKVRVTDFSSPARTDVTDGYFTIAPPSITVLSPAGGEKWVVATQQAITWQSRGNISNVKMEYSTNGGTSWSTIVSSTSNTGSYNWTIPNYPSTNCKVRVSDASASSVNSVSNTFTISGPYIEVTSPNGGEEWLVGSVHAITWNKQGSLSSNVSIYYKTTNTNSWTTVTSSATNSGTYNWTVPNTPSTICKVKVQDYSNSSIFDTSNSAFTISGPKILLSSPNGGEDWVVGSVHPITWTTQGNVSANVSIFYKTTNTNSWTTVTSSATNSGTYNWTIPNSPSTTCKVKVQDYSNASIFDTSSNTFTISGPRITVTSPNGGEDWIVGTVHAITWTSQGNVSGNVSISYKTTNTNSWTTITSSTSNNGTYNWTIPNNPSTVCKVRVVDYSNSAVFDTSDYVFTISPPRLTVTSPNGGEDWVIGSVHAITWTSQGSVSGSVALSYKTTNTNTWTTITSSTSNNGSYNWTIPSAPSTQCRVKITDYSNSSVFDTSNYVFTISGPKISLSSPNGGESWVVGTVHAITWTSQGNVSANVAISYKTTNTNSWTTIVSSTSNNGSYNWTIPNTPSAVCKVKVQDYSNSSVFDTSAANFTIAGPGITVTAPSGGEVWLVGATKNITWTSIGTVSSTVKIYYKTTNSSSWTTIASSATNSGSYAWTVPNTPSTLCKVKVQDYNNSAIFDTSNYNFTITGPYFTVLSPNGGENWVVGTQHELRWTWEGSVSSSVRLAYRTSPTGSWTTIANGVPNSGSYMWSVANVPSADCLIRVQDYANSAIGDTSDRTFTISPNPNDFILVTNPHGFESWTAGTTQTITWYNGGNVNNVNILYSTDSGLSWSSIVANRSNTASLSWVVPNTPSTRCRVKVQEVSRTEIFNMSDNDFTILKSTAVEDSPVPAHFSLCQNYPNPFNPSTVIRFAIPHRTHVDIAVFNCMGQQVALPQSGELEAGYHVVQVDAKGLSSGVYFYRMRAGDFVETKRLLLLR